MKACADNKMPQPEVDDNTTKLIEEQGVESKTSNFENGISISPR